MDVKKAKEDLRKGKIIYDMHSKVEYYERVSTDKDNQLNLLKIRKNMKLIKSRLKRQTCFQKNEIVR